MKFTKMQGCGNDYIYVNCFAENVEDRPALARKISDRHFGIGGDGLICIDRSDVADFKMDMYNADGSHGKMCGNGIRCVAKYVYDNGMTDKTELTVETGSGVKTLQLQVEDGKVSTVRVCMGSPEFRPAQIPMKAEGENFIMRPIEVCGKRWDVTAVSMGNPHAVVFVDNVDWLNLEEIGPAFENHPMFPERVNTEFVQVVDEHTLKMRVWERGSGETLACGTGSSASLAAAVVCGKSAARVKMLLRGGELEIEWNRAENLIYMTGPAVKVFDGTFDE
ncbi:MAG: diaminopimelate epimerase [Oscillospiraceae bacterium]|nr:diaminopimelate epimerase [Oscillospiraceae bacterium]MDD6502660.1 diaminopimelate epimerase [Oscillospiraceae bacterium]MDY4105195.1 diaminopimelate epimerase [Oscillospiraceae bacterium]